MGIIAWIVLGGLAGWVASMVMGSNSSQGTLGDIITGIIGAVVGGFIMNLLGEPGVTGFNIYSLIVAVGGALLFIWAKRSLA